MTDSMPVRAQNGAYNVNYKGVLSDSSRAFALQLTSEELRTLQAAIDEALEKPIQRYKQAQTAAAEELWAYWLAAGAIQSGPDVLLRFFSTDSMWRALERGQTHPVDGGANVRFPSLMKCLSFSMWGRSTGPIVHLYDRPLQALCMGAGRAASGILPDDDGRDVCRQCVAEMHRQTGKKP